MVYQQWRHQFSSPQLPEAMNAGGEQDIRARYTYGTPWRIRIYRTRCRFSVVRTKGWYGLGTNITAGSWGNKIMGWWRRGDIKSHEV
jgi:hypothetical protein